MLEQLERLRAFLAGKKTFLVSGAAVLTALAAFSTGTITSTELIQALYQAAAACTIKAGIGRVTQEPKP